MRTLLNLWYIFYIYRSFYQYLHNMTFWTHHCCTWRQLVRSGVTQSLWCARESRDPPHWLPRPLTTPGILSKWVFCQILVSVFFYLVKRNLCNTRRPTAWGSKRSPHTASPFVFDFVLEKGVSHFLSCVQNWWNLKVPIFSGGGGGERWGFLVLTLRQKIVKSQSPFFWAG